MARRIAAALAAMTLLATPAVAEKPWDRGAVNALATDLAGKARVLRDTLGHEPAVAGETGAAQGDAARLVEAVGGMGNAARRLARALGEPRDADATRPLYNRIRKLAGDAERYGRAIMPPAWVEQNLGPIQETLDQIAAYYE